MSRKSGGKKREVTAGLILDVITGFCNWWSLAHLDIGEVSQEQQLSNKNKI